MVTPNLIVNLSPLSFLCILNYLFMEATAQFLLNCVKFIVTDLSEAEQNMTESRHTTTMSKPRSLFFAVLTFLS